MKKNFKFFILFSLFFSTSLVANETLAIVNGAEITTKDVNDFVIKSIPGATFFSLTEEQKKKVINQMIDRRLYLEDAQKSHIEKKLAYQRDLQKLQENLLLDYWMKEQVESLQISDKEIHQYYLNHQKEFLKPASVKVRHILLSTEDEAITLIGELESSMNLKEDFIRLAQTQSIGPSAQNGGALDWFVFDQMVPEFSQAAFALEMNSITKKAVKTQFGYHIIYLEDKKLEGLIPYEVVKDDIVKSLRLSRFKLKLEKISKKMKKTAKIIVK